MQQSRLKGLVSPCSASPDSDGKLLKTTSFSESSVLIELLSDTALVFGSETRGELLDKTGCS